MKIVQTGIRMLDHLNQKLKDIAEYKGRTLNSLMLEALEEYVTTTSEGRRKEARK